MHSVTSIIVLAFILQAHAKDLAVNHTNDEQDKLSDDNFRDMFIDKLVDRAFNLWSSRDMDDTTLGKPGQLTLNRPSGILAHQVPRPSGLPLSQPSRISISQSPGAISPARPSILKSPGRMGPRPPNAYHQKIDQYKALTPELTKALDTNFPGAIPGTAFHDQLASILQKYGFTPENTIMGTSICSDEINTLRGGMIEEMTGYWGENFPLGGIGGAPYVGKTGFGAFSAHVPKEGNVFVLFGPHVGLTAEGEVGKCQRDGQAAPSTACGACVAAYNQLLGGFKDSGDRSLDMQQAWLRQVLASSVKRVERAKDPMAELSKATYEQVRDTMEVISNTNFGPGYLALVGGIQINMPPGYPDYFQPLYFTLQKTGQGAISVPFERKRDKFFNFLRSSLVPS